MRAARSSFLVQNGGSKWVMCRLRRVLVAVNFQNGGFGAQGFCVRGNSIRGGLMHGFDQGTC